MNCISRPLAAAIAGWLIGLGGMAGPAMAKDPYLAAQLAEIDRVNAAGRWDADWQSLSQHEIPEWFQDAKFGIYAHWGVYSVPAFGNEWYPRNMYREGSSTFKHHVERYGGPGQFAVNERKQLVLDVGDLSAASAPCRYAYSFRLEGFELDIQPDAVRQAPKTETVHD